MKNAAENNKSILDHFRTESKLTKDQFLAMMDIKDGSLQNLELDYKQQIAQNRAQYVQLKNKLMEEAWLDYNTMVEFLYSAGFFGFSPSFFFKSLFYNNPAPRYSKPVLELQKMEDFIFQPIRGMYPRGSDSTLQKPSNLSTHQVIDLPILRYNDVVSAFEVYGTNLTVAISNTQATNAVALIEAGANINKYALLFGTNPLLLAVMKGWNHIQLGSLRKDDETQKTILLHLLAKDDLDVNAIFLGNGMTALHIACLRGDDPVFIKHLLARGADPTLEDYEGNLPETYLTFSYEKAKSAFAPLIYDAEFGYNGDPTKSYVASLPTPEERVANVEEIKNLFIQHQPERSPGLTL